MLIAAVYSLKILEVVGIRGYHKQYFSPIKTYYQKEKWNPVIFSIESGNLQILKFFAEVLKVNMNVSLCNPVYSAEEQPVHLHHEESTCFGILVAIRL